ncbi:Hpt domain-containing protein [Zhouia sp. PK063]|uniref:Hpt domain-containing protein n=1 Tax=Zhouia sp. PK063 TaxID=3373602 RepID=UPI0037BB6191
MHYSLDKLNELGDGDQDFVISVIAVFVEETPDDLESLGNAVTSEDYTAIYQASHKMKPNIDLMGMEEVTKEILSIENNGKNKSNMDAIKIAFTAVKPIILETIDELKATYSL